MAFGIGIFKTKTETNVGTLWRSAFNFGASFIFTIGQRYKKQSSDTVASWKQIPLFNYIDFQDFKDHIPYDYQIICIENDAQSISIKNFVHPKNCIYLLGAEDNGLSKEILEKYKTHLIIPSKYCLNVAVSGSIVMYDRIIKDRKE